MSVQAGETIAVTATDEGLHCGAGGFHIDPWAPVAEAVVTHGHGDHARPGSARYVCAAEAAPVLARRLGPDAVIEAHPYGERFARGAATVSFHPAGHVLGSAQVRIEVGGHVTVISGDYKRAPDPTCAPLEVVPCDTFITEATFALPIYRWDPADIVVRDILAWWEAGVRAGRPSVLFCYALGKAQRILAELARISGESSGRRVWVHGMVEPLVALYRAAGVAMLPTEVVPEKARSRGQSWDGELILAPPVAMATPWMRRFPQAETAFASGWMRIRGTRRRRGVDRGFALSDHADWPALLDTIRETGARRVLATHGFKEPLVRFLGERGVAAEVLRTAFEGEADV